ncbi:hypothetical protein [Bradyrhizobium lablabi]|uniref:hypothetical protein n=1 Tax=Bradyrhizobium lablabi TaxID=722472 RepID=UPI001BA4C603|nr:hypothetical protein [Bradyrhizobium lablabi]MBR0697942.1 hypothetical protein [Bradyrhizobium lablabi]
MPVNSDTAKGVTSARKMTGEMKGASKPIEGNRDCQALFHFCVTVPRATAPERSSTAFSAEVATGLREERVETAIWAAFRQSRQCSRR